MMRKASAFFHNNETCFWYIFSTTESLRWETFGPFMENGVAFITTGKCHDQYLCCSCSFVEFVLFMNLVPLTFSMWWLFSGSLASPNITQTWTTWAGCRGRSSWAAPGASPSFATSLHRWKIITNVNNNSEPNLRSYLGAAAVNIGRTNSFRKL